MSEKKNTAQEGEGTEIVKREPTASERFAITIQHQFAAEAGSVPEFNEYERTLAQHLFLKVDAILKDFEAKRLDKGDDKLPYEWSNINMVKLAIDAVHRVKLGLDALIPNHIHPVPYFNRRLNKYDLDLRVGYVGKDYYRREYAMEKPQSIRYELVYSSDTFEAIMKSFDVDVESYKFAINNPFERGDIIGGFGYIDFGEDKKARNKLVLVTKADFNKSRNHAAGKTFWENHPTEMMFKTLVHRVTEKLPLDPRSVNSASYAYVEYDDNAAEGMAFREIEESANTIVIDADDIIPKKNANVEVIDANEVTPSGNTAAATPTVEVDESTGEVIGDPDAFAQEQPQTADLDGQQSMDGYKRDF